MKASRPSAVTPRVRFAENLCRIRAKSGQSQEEVANLTAMHRTEISALERAEREPRLGTLLKLSAALEVPLGDFFEGVEWSPILLSSGSPGRFHIAPAEPDEGSSSP